MDVTLVVWTVDQSATDSEVHRVWAREAAEGEEGVALGPEMPALVTVCKERGFLVSQGPFL